MAQAANDHMENLAYCFDTGGSQEDGKCSKGLYALLRFYVPNLLKTSPRFSKHVMSPSLNLIKYMKAILKIVWASQ